MNVNASIQEIERARAAVRAMLPTLGEVAENLKRASEGFKKAGQSLEDFSKAFAFERDRERI